MLQYSQIGIQALIEFFFGKQILAQQKALLPDFSQHSSFRFCSQNCIMRQDDIAQKINSLPKFSDRYLVRMKFKF